MPIEITGRYRDRSRDVAVEATPSARLSDVLPLIADAVGAPPATAAWLGDRLLADTASMQECGLRRGDVVTFGQRPTPAQGHGVLALRVIGGPAAGTVRPLSPGRLVIGRDADCDLTLPDADVSRRHAALEVGASAITLADLGSTNGTRVDGRVVPAGGVRVAHGALITLGDSTLTLTGPAEPPAVCRSAADGTSVVLRAPRRAQTWPADSITLPQPPGAGRPRGVQWLAALVPAAAGAGLAWFAHAPQFLLFALLSPAMMISTAVGDRLHWRRSRRRAAASYRQRRAEAENVVAARLADEARARRRAAPDPATVAVQAALPGSRLWERRRTDPDALSVRLGLTQLDSTLAVQDGGPHRPAGVLDAVPAVVDLRRGPLGVAGPAGVVDALGRWLVGQLAALHSPADLEFALLLDPERATQWAWARWLPHLRGRVAASSEDAAALLAEIGSSVEQQHAHRAVEGAQWHGSWLVLVVDRAGRFGEIPGLDGVLARGAEAGVAAICLDTTAAGLPAASGTVAQVDAPVGSRLSVRGTGVPELPSVIVDQVSPAWAATLARALAALQDGAGTSAALPARLDLLDLYPVGALEAPAIDARWRVFTGGARAPVGVTADGPFEIDLQRDGPHALVAGTTGSGKSELLQVLVAGLAANQPPDELNVLLVDYKGGAAFADCARLPHAVGLVTDLDQYLTERALRALSSELRRRERLFAARGVRDLAQYLDCADRESVPRLVIVVDEFAALAEELPDFVRGLVAVAQRGRSLGVHLVLATQRPATAVSPEIRANTDLRIALRVADAGESQDVLDVPDAAGVSRSAPGRGHARIGGSLSSFQGAHAASPNPPPTTRPICYPLGPWLRAAAATDAGAESQLARLVGALQAAAARTGRAPARAVWLPPLPQRLALRELEQTAHPTTVALGRVDLPDEQRVAPLTLDLAAGPSVLVAGAPRSGRTSALAAVALAAAAQLSPRALQLHVVDATGALTHSLRPLPHCATVLGSDELALAPRLLHRLEVEAARRVAAAPRAGQASLVLLVDGWETMCSALSDLDAALCAERLAGLLRVGPAARLTAVVAGDRTTLAPRFAGAFGQRLVLRMADRADYTFAGLRLADVPTELPPGRAVRATDGALVQLAHPGDSPEPAAWRRRATELARRSPRCPPRADAVVVRALPARVALTELPTQPGRLLLGVAGDDAEPVALDPFDGNRRVLVTGPPRSGRSTTLRLLATQAAAARVPVRVAAPDRSPLAVLAREQNLPLLTPTSTGRITLPAGPALLLVDDCETFGESMAGEQLCALARSDADVTIVGAARADDLATTYRGVSAELRRGRCGILLRPGPLDGELLGIRLPRRPAAGPPGRGIAVGDGAWGPLFAAGEPVPIQVATL